jgi:GH25 family lysozyme M1 (1,4-beta-N-acetylmuramidase)
MSWTLGIDVSRWQGDLDFSKLHAPGVVEKVTGKPIEFDYIKATHGSGCDPYFVQNAKNSNVLQRRGFYHWFVPTQDPILQADHFIDVISSFDRFSDLPPSMDFEDDANGRVRGQALIDAGIAFMDRVEDLLGIHKMVCYTGRWFWQQACLDIDSIEFADRPLWHSEYPGYVPKEEFVPHVALPWKSRELRETFFQFDGDKGLVLPVGGVDSDFNRFMGTVEELDAFIRWCREPLRPRRLDPGTAPDDWRIAVRPDTVLDEVSKE